jgi:uncharacterized protein YbbK (DUF523 family)
MMLMKTFVKPRIIISKCIEFDFCRYNSQIIRSEIVKKLKPHVEFLPICAEVEIGLGVPRDSIRIVEKHTKKLLAQIKTNKLKTKGEPYLMRYNSPFTPGFLRRNEVAIEVI